MTYEKDRWNAVVFAADGLSADAHCTFFNYQEFNLNKKLFGLAFECLILLALMFLRPMQKTQQQS